MVKKSSRRVDHEQSGTKFVKKYFPSGQQKKKWKKKKRKFVDGGPRVVLQLRHWASRQAKQRGWAHKKKRLVGPTRVPPASGNSSRNFGSARASFKGPKLGCGWMKLWWKNFTSWQLFGSRLCDFSDGCSSPVSGASQLNHQTRPFIGMFHWKHGCFLHHFTKLCNRKLFKFIRLLLTAAQIRWKQRPDKMADVLISSQFSTCHAPAKKKKLIYSRHLNRRHFDWNLKNSYKISQSAWNHEITSSRRGPSADWGPVVIRPESSPQRCQSGGILFWRWDTIGCVNFGGWRPPPGRRLFVWWMKAFDASSDDAIKHRRQVDLRRLFLFGRRWRCRLIRADIVADDDSRFILVRRAHPQRGPFCRWMKASGSRKKTIFIHRRIDSGRKLFVFSTLSAGDLHISFIFTFISSLHSFWCVSFPFCESETAGSVRWLATQMNFKIKSIQLKLIRARDSA